MTVVACPAAYVLNFQASYRCRHSGTCCTSGWPIPMDPGRTAIISQSLSSGTLRAPGLPDAALLHDREGLPAGVACVLGTDPSGACAFYDRSARRCAIHSRLGPRALPVSCAHFPRVVLIDVDGIYISLSHYCPTVADLLFEKDGPVEVVSAPSSLLENIEPEGLDARGEMPPLLLPNLLADRAGFRAWERWVVKELGAADGGAEAAWWRVARVTRQVARWRPGSGSLVEWLADSIGTNGSRNEEFIPIEFGAAAPVLEEVRQSVPGPFRPPPAPAAIAGAAETLVEPGWAACSGPVGRYLAAKAFGSWAAYQGEGMQGVVRAVFEALAVLRFECARQCCAAGRVLDAALLKQAIRQSDLLLVHLSQSRSRS